MDNSLLILKKLLNSIDIDVVAIDKNAISLITDEAILKINDREW